MGIVCVREREGENEWSVSVVLYKDNCSQEVFAGFAFLSSRQKLLDAPREASLFCLPNEKYSPETHNHSFSAL